MSTKATTTVESTCDGCGRIVIDGERVQGWIAIHAEGDQQGNAFGEFKRTPLYIVVSGRMRRADRLDYCSAECAAKHLGGTPKP